MAVYDTAGEIDHILRNGGEFCDPKAPTREEFEAGLDLGAIPDIGTVVDIGEPPAGWCPLPCDCGQPCAEFVGHRPPCVCFDG